MTFDTSITESIVVSTFGNYFIYIYLPIILLAMIHKANHISRAPLFSRKSFYLLTAIIFSLLFYSCSRFQYVSVNSSMHQTDNKEFIIENDTVIIKYRFEGENMRVKVSLYNKLFQPIYVDVERSTVVINNEQLSPPFYYNDQYGFIAPQSFIDLSSSPLRYTFFEGFSDDTTNTIATKTKYGTNRVFNEISTPMHFRSILAIATNEYYDQPTFFDSSFWISDIFESMVTPVSSTDKPKNQFYLKNETFYGGFMGVMGVVALVLVGGVMGPGL